MTARIDSATLVAYLDGELGHTAALRVEAALAGDPWLQQQLEALRRVDRALDAAFQPILDSPLPALALTERPPMTTEGRPAPSSRAMRLALAAGLAGLFVGFAGGQLSPTLVWEGEPPGVAAIQAQLPEVLETQLSGTTVAFNDRVKGVSGTVKPLTTFVNADGRYCRAFEAHVAENETNVSSRGVACRDREGRWVTRVQVNAA
ncbi:MAG: RT0821/Lpp0805 family surface protein [Geminicoccaceae bacterium]